MVGKSEMEAKAARDNLKRGNPLNLRCDAHEAQSIFIPWLKTQPNKEVVLRTTSSRVFISTSCFSFSR